MKSDFLAPLISLEYIERWKSEWLGLRLYSAEKQDISVLKVLKLSEKDKTLVKILKEEEKNDCDWWKHISLYISYFIKIPYIKMFIKKLF